MGIQRERESLRIGGSEKLLELGFGRYELASLVIFGILSLGAMFTERMFFGAYVAILIADILATLLDSGIIISLDRSVFAFLFILLGSFSGEFGAFQIIVATLVLITVLDISFLLRRIEDTKVSKGIISGRLRSYLYTILPSFLVSYAVIFLYSQITVVGSVAVLVLGLGSVGAFLIVYHLVRSISNPRISFVSVASKSLKSKNEESF